MTQQCPFWSRQSTCEFDMLISDRKKNNLLMSMTLPLDELFQSAVRYIVQLDQYICLLLLNMKNVYKKSQIPIINRRMWSNIIIKQGTYYLYVYIFGCKVGRRTFIPVRRIEDVGGISTKNGSILKIKMTVLSTIQNALSVPVRVYTQLNKKSVKKLLQCANILNL